MTPDQAIAILRRHRQTYADKLVAHARRTDSLHYLNKDEREHVNNNIQALDMAIVSLSLIGVPQPTSLTDKESLP